MEPLTLNSGLAYFLVNNCLENPPPSPSPSSYYSKFNLYAPRMHYKVYVV